MDPSAPVIGAIIELALIYSFFAIVVMTVLVVAELTPQAVRVAWRTGCAACRQTAAHLRWALVRVRRWIEQADRNA